MVSADVFVAETEFKNQESFRGLVASGYLPALAGDAVSIADMLRLGGEARHRVHRGGGASGLPTRNPWK